MKLIKKIISKILPKDLLLFLRRKKNYLKYKKLIEETYWHYREVENSIEARKDKKLRVAAYVVFDSTFGAYDLFDLMLENENHYSPKIVVVPDVSRGEEHLVQQYFATKEFFVKKYGSENVIDGWNASTKEFVDCSSMFDIIYLANPYDSMVNKVHGISYLSTQNVLPFYMSYGCMPDNYGCKIIMPMKEISLFWKVFADNEMSYKDYCKYELAKGKNVVLSGYAKMDSLAKFSEHERERKRIIIAPHHTISNKELPLSNFVKYSDFFLELPKIFPDIDFIFRPHPLLFTNMVNEGFWTENQKSEYIEELKNAGFCYSVGGDYFDIFVNSDAMIHDCSSFVVEYLYTGKPCCFMAKKEYEKVFSNLGKSCLENYYLCFEKEQIIDFINNIVINGNDILKETRESYAVNNLAINYPNVSKEILKIISFDE